MQSIPVIRNILCISDKAKTLSHLLIRVTLHLSNQIIEKCIVYIQEGISSYCEFDALKAQLKNYFKTRFFSFGKSK